MELNAGEPKAPPPGPENVSCNLNLKHVFIIVLLILIVPMGISVCFKLVAESMSERYMSRLRDTIQAGIKVNVNYTFNGLEFLEPTYSWIQLGDLDLQNDTVTEQLKQLEIVIVDCPVASNNDYIGVNTSELVALLGKFNTDAMENDRPPIKVWLRLNPEEETDGNSLCTQLAVFGNRIYPEILEGVVGSNNELEAPAYEKWLEFHQQTSSGSRSTKLTDYPVKIKQFHEQGLKFGFMLDSTRCFRFPAMVPENITSQLDEIFYYFEDGRLSLTILDNVPYFITSNNYDECKDFMAEKVPSAQTVKYVKSQAYMSYAEFVRVFSTKNHEKDEINEISDTVSSF